jgi:hypothetical protein
VVLTEGLLTCRGSESQVCGPCCGLRRGGYAPGSTIEACRLNAYAHAADVFREDPRAFAVAERLAESWVGTDEELITVVRGILQDGSVDL